MEEIDVSEVIIKSVKVQSKGKWYNFVTNELNYKKSG